MRIQSRRLGTLEYTSDEVIAFPHGIPAFENSRQFLLVRRAQSAPILFLQSIEEPSLSLPVVEANCLLDEYRLDLASEDRAALGLAEGDLSYSDITILFVVAQFESHATVNLVAPVVIREGRGVQAVRADKTYSAVQRVTSLDRAFAPC